jgi:hypothetical protein
VSEVEGPQGLSLCRGGLPLWTANKFAEPVWKLRCSIVGKYLLYNVIVVLNYGKHDENGLHSLTILFKMN